LTGGYCCRKRNFDLALIFGGEITPICSFSTDAMPHADLSSYIYSFSYLGIFLWFAVGEQLTPIPEEISLITLGYISKYSSLNPVIAGVVSLAGLLLTDNFLFYISMKGSKFSDKLLRKTNNKILTRIKENLKTNAVRTLIIMALLPKVRFVSPIISGINGISWKMFLSVNSIAAAGYVTVYMFIGIFFYNQLSRLLQKLGPMQNIIFAAFMVILAIFLTLMVRRSTRK